MNILITGAASGIGQAAATYFSTRGHQVYGIDVAQNACTFTADITDEKALLAVREQLGETKLDAIINVAGMHLMTSLVEGDFSRMKKAVDSEVASLDPLPFNGLYSVTKTALDAYGQALRQELNLLGQKVITIRPGAVETPLCHSSVQATADLAEGTELYKKQARNFSGLAVKFMGKPVKPEKIAALLYKAATVKHPRLIYQKNRNPGLVLLNWLPKGWQCGIIKLLLRLNLF